MAYGTDSAVYGDLRDKLDVTWEDSGTAKKLLRILNGCVEVIDALTGAAPDEVDYNADGGAKELLLNRCMYEWHNAAGDFQSEYISEIMALRMRRESASNA